MNHKLAFILPRFALITLAAGLGAIALFAVFKILLVVMAVAAVVMLIKAIGRLFTQESHSGFHEFAFENAEAVPSRRADTIVPVHLASRPVIVPIG